LLLFLIATRAFLSLKVKTMPLPLLTSPLVILSTERKESLLILLRAKRSIVSGILSDQRLPLPFMVVLKISTFNLAPRSFIWVLLTVQQSLTSQMWLALQEWFTPLNSLRDLVEI